MSENRDAKLRERAYHLAGQLSATPALAQYETPKWAEDAVPFILAALRQTEEEARAECDGWSKRGVAMGHYRRVYQSGGPCHESCWVCYLVAEGERAGRGAEREEIVKLLLSPERRQEYVFSGPIIIPKLAALVRARGSE